jgi:hypothetical protein
MKEIVKAISLHWRGLQTKEACGTLRLFVYIVGHPAVLLPCTSLCVLGLQGYRYADLSRAYIFRKVWVDKRYRSNVEVAEEVAEIRLKS